MAEVLGTAMLAGLLVGIVAATGSRGFQGWARKSTPLPGAYYSGCNDARAAGVAPLYAGEPGYREEMDGDGDGIACEPYRHNRY